MTALPMQNMTLSASTIGSIGIFAKLANFAAERHQMVTGCAPAYRAIAELSALSSAGYRQQLPPRACLTMSPVPLSFLLCGFPYF
jgi:hypothetical protein